MTLVAPVLYPSLINRACSIVDEWEVLKHQPDCFFRVILRIVKKVNLKRPTAAVFAKRATLASEAGQSVQTVNRTIKWLETEGLITRTKKANKGLRGSRSPLVLSDQFLRLLMLDPLSIQQSYTAAEDFVLAKYAKDTGIEPDEKRKPKHPSAGHDAPGHEEGRAEDVSNAASEDEVAETDSALDLEEKLHVDDEPQPVANPTESKESTSSAAVVMDPEVPEAAGAAPQVDKVVETLVVPELADKYQAVVEHYKAATAKRAAQRDDRRGFVQIGAVKIPTDLTWLVDNLGMRATGVLQLMGVAKKADQTLSEVVRAVSKYLVDLDGREAYAYLRKLLGLGKDFAHKVTEQNQLQDEEAERSYLAMKAEALAGRSFFSAKQQAQYTIQANAVVQVLQDGKSFAVRLSRKMLDAIDAGKLRAVRT